LTAGDEEGSGRVPGQDLMDRGGVGLRGRLRSLRRHNGGMETRTLLHVMASVRMGMGSDRSRDTGFLHTEEDSRVHTDTRRSDLHVVALAFLAVALVAAAVALADAAARRGDQKSRRRSLLPRNKSKTS
jgi:hypothetical protein